MKGEMIERVARALWESDPHADEKAKWDDLPAHCKRLGEPDVQEQYRDHARAALKAMRQPTETMKGYAKHRLPGISRGTAHDVWMLMIDEALAN